jgi:hypothetical protein
LGQGRFRHKGCRHSFPVTRFQRGVALFPQPPGPSLL